MDLRIGHGFDVHRLEAGRKLIIGGADIPYDRGLAGHSDADVLCHALIDAMLGAVGRSDIGTRFPNSDPAWKDSNSLKLLAIVCHEIHDSGWRIMNADICIFAEAPKLQEYIPSMKGNIARAIGIGTDSIGIKAGTMEKLGALGRGEGIGASAVVLLQR